jgi:asparagine synthase (glutamine-hydrolysing)
MCGIAGLIDFHCAQPSKELLCRMIGYIRHRGPDAAGIYRNGPAGLAHARLSIIDLSGGDQPICNENRRVWVVFNGEIFNYPELTRELMEKGHVFYTRSDTEVLVHLYEELGIGMFNKLNGQFAFALWDADRQQLLLARDRLGIRPLFYYQKDGRLVFGSEIKAIFADPDVPRRLNPAALSEVFTCWAPLDSQTAFRDVYQVPPGHFALFSQKQLSIRRYWALPFQPQTDLSELSLEECTAELEQLLHDATRIRLRADVPVGAYLSGGLDSTLTGAMVKKHFNNLLRTFSVSFTDERYDEAPFQARAIEALKTEHRQERCAEGDIGADFPKVVWHSEVPLLRTAPAPLFRLSKLVRENNFKVVLTGEGADEFFAGYNIFKEDRVRRFWARHPESKLRPQLLARLYPYIFSNNGKGGRILEGFFKKGLTDIDSPVYAHLLRWTNTSQLKSFFSPELRQQTENLQSFVERYQATLPADFMTWPPLSRVQYTEIRIFLSNYLLAAQGDRMAMAHGVEGRYPFLDHRVVEFASRIAPGFKLNGLKEKYILKQVARKYIPAGLIERAKQPYRAPISRCFFNEDPPPFVAELLSEAAVKRGGYFDAVKVAGLAAKCSRQDGRLLSERENMALVGILSTQLLDDQFIRNFPSKSIEEPKNVKVFGISKNDI